MFQAEIDRMGLVNKEKVMEILTSWEEKAMERIAVNLLREGMSAEFVVRVTGVTQERVQQLQAELEQEG